MTNNDIKTPDIHFFDPADLAALGEGEVAYVKSMQSDEIRRIFPQAPDLAPGLQLFALLSASGALRMGAGLVTVASDPETRRAISLSLRRHLARQESRVSQARV